MPIYWNLWGRVPKWDESGFIFTVSWGTGMLFGLGGHRSYGWCVSLFLGPFVFTVGWRTPIDGVMGQLTKDSE